MQPANHAYTQKFHSPTTTVLLPSLFMTPSYFSRNQINILNFN
jgi:hypothetical protein